MSEDWPDAADNSKRSHEVAVDAMRERLEQFRCERIGPHRLYMGDCRELIPLIGQMDAVVTDPPYGIGFMGKKWDQPGAFVERKAATENKFDHVGGNHNPSNAIDSARTRRVEGQKYSAWCETWAAECLRTLKPGGHLAAFGGDRTFHRLYCAIEDSGFEPRHTGAWLYGSGFPKSLNVSKQIEEKYGWCECDD